MMRRCDFIAGAKCLELASLTARPRRTKTSCGSKANGGIAIRRLEVISRAFSRTQSMQGWHNSSY
jgi:hypothetical protein